ncbi:MAG: hypothetical protein PVG78_01270 [Desulfobacterales bacterium]
MGNLNRKQTLVVVLMDLALLTALCVAVYLSRTGSGDVTFVFLKFFVPAVLATVTAARIAIRRLAGPASEPEDDPAADRT